VAKAGVNSAILKEMSLSNLIINAEHPGVNHAATGGEHPTARLLADITYTKANNTMVQYLH